MVMYIAHKLSVYSLCDVVVDGVVVVVDGVVVVVDGVVVVVDSEKPTSNSKLIIMQKVCTRYYIYIHIEREIVKQ